MGLFKKIKNALSDTGSPIISDVHPEPSASDIDYGDYSDPRIYMNLSAEEYKSVSLIQSKSFRGFKRITLSVSDVPGAFENIRSFGIVNPQYVDGPESIMVSPGYSVAWHGTNKYLFNLSGKTITFHVPYNSLIPTSVFVDDKIIGVMPYEESSRRATFYNALMNDIVSSAHLNMEHGNRCELIPTSDGTESVSVKDSFKAYLFLPVSDD